MSSSRIVSLGLGGLFAFALAVGCGDNDDAPDNDQTAGKGGSSAGAGNEAGSSGSSSDAGGKAGSGGNAGSAGKSGTPAGGYGGDGDALALGGAGASGEAPQGGRAGESAGGQGGDGAQTASCESVRAGLLSPVAAVSTGLVTITSDTTTEQVTAVVDGSAGGIAAAATNPYIYVSLANKARVDVTDTQADTSTAWDVAFKRDNIRSNGGDSGAGSAQVAVIAGKTFEAVTAADAVGATFERDDFVDDVSCDPVVDQTGKPLTSFDGWYEYDGATMRLTPADQVYLVRGANGTSLFKLRITGYYVDVADGMGGTVKKSAVFSLTYQAL